eukprot:COSAG02_NODE_42302_length_385_cov_3.657343_1_plen_68_part_00
MQTAACITVLRAGVGAARARARAGRHTRSVPCSKDLVRGRGARGRGCTRSERAGARGALLVDDSLGT